MLVGLERHGVTAIALLGAMDDKAISLQLMGDGEKLVDEPHDIRNLTLESIRHRIRALGGVVHVDHPANGGIVVEVSTPIANVVSPS